MPFPKVNVPVDILIVCGEAEVPLPPKIIAEEDALVGAKIPTVAPCCNQFPFTVNVSVACFKVEPVFIIIPPQVKDVILCKVTKPAVVPSPIDRVPLILYVPLGPKPQPLF